MHAICQWVCVIIINVYLIAAQYQKDVYENPMKKTQIKFH